MTDVGKILILAGGALILAGVLITAAGKIPGLGRLPGDILIKKENFTFYFPVMTSVLVSIVISLIFYLWNRR